MRTLIKKLLLILCLCSVCRAAQIIRYVDPGAAGANNGTSWGDAYTTLSHWELDEQQNLTDNGGDIMTVYCKSSTGADDTTTCTILGWTTSATSYIEIIQTDFPADGIFDGSKYVLAGTNTVCLTISENYVRVGPLQVQCTETGAENAYGIYVVTIDAGGSDIRIDSCIIKGICSGTAYGCGIITNDGDATMKIFNCVIYGFKSGTTTSFIGIYPYVVGSMIVYNCTIQKCYYGIFGSVGTVTINNCASFNNNDDFAGSNTVIAYCASDDGNGTNAEDFTAEATDWNKVFTDYTNDDVSLKDYTISPCCVSQGTDDPGAGLYSDDIIGTARSSVWDIGAFEYAAPPPAVGGQVIIVNME